MVAIAESPLKKRVIRSSVWSVGGHIVSQLIRLAGNLITTRLLMPEMFGVMAIANIIFIGVEMFSDLGIQQNIIQSRRGHDPVFLNTAWTLQILRGVLLALIVLLLAGLIDWVGQHDGFPKASAYANPMLPSVVAMLSIAPILGGLESTKLALARRNLDLARYTVLEILSQAAGPSTIIVWCSFDRSLWALVAGWIAVSFTRFCLSHILLNGPRNQWLLDKEILKTLYHFGKWIFVSSILGFLLNNGDRILFGAYMSAHEMGIYSIAFLMTSAVESLLRKLVTGVSFPALSELYRNEPDRFKANYYRFRRPIDILSLFAVGIVFSCAQALIDLFYDQRYHDAGWMLQMMAVSLFFIRFEIAGLCYLVIDKPKLLTIVNFLRMLGLYVSVPLIFEMAGIQWAILIAAANGIIALPLIFYFNARHGFFSAIQELRVLPALFFGLFAGALFSIALNEVAQLDYLKLKALVLSVL